MKVVLLLLPGLGTILFLMGDAFYTTISHSLGLGSEENRFTLQYWNEMLSDSILWRSVGYSFRTSLLGTLGAVLLAYPIALWLTKPLQGKNLIIGMLRAPMFVPGLVAAFLLMNVISYHGIINEGLLAIGVIDKPIRMTNDSFGWSVVFLQIWKNLPFALILIGGSVNSIRTDLLHAASDMGASRFAKFRQVIFPLTIPALQASMILIFIGAMGDYAFASIAGSRTSYSMTMLMYFTAYQYLEWEKVYVIAVVLMTIAALGAIVITAVLQPFARKRYSLISLDKAGLDGVAK
ncbi:ABC transporter permease [Grimontia sp. SpTr1]|uniref:ABC transporter permease n=1 Tax=Grimontia sp. SpTr1 TaxID=2995319 RepID=UPI00248C0E0A|nr:ABC transporter permease [Grimontia sp. SpTr1]